MRRGRHQPALQEWPAEGGWAVRKRCQQEPGGRENSMAGHAREARTREPNSAHSEEHRTIGGSPPEAGGEGKRR